MLLGWDFIKVISDQNSVFGRCSFNGGQLDANRMLFPLCPAMEGDSSLDLTHLTEEEQSAILQVLQRDLDLQLVDEGRVRSEVTADVMSVFFCFLLFLRNDQQLLLGDQ